MSVLWHIDRQAVMTHNGDCNLCGKSWEKIGLCPCGCGEMLCRWCIRAVRRVLLSHSVFPQTVSTQTGLMGRVPRTTPFHMMQSLQDLASAECSRQTRVMEEILKIAYASGVESVTIKWPNELMDSGGVMYELPVESYARWKLRRKIRRLGHSREYLK